MARVISWQIAGKYVYIEKQGSTHILDSKLPNSEVKAMGSRVTNWPEATYSANFAEMRSEVVGRWGESVDLRSDYQYYFNATGEEGVYMLTGIDGANIADYGKEFYNLVIENNNTSLGLGGDYKLDAAATLHTTIYLERNGEKYAPDRVSIKLGEQNVNFTPSVVDGYKWKLAINVPRGTQFDSAEHILEYTIHAEKGTVWDGEVVFTVVGVKDGEEGVSYDLLVSPRVIKVNSEGVPSANYVVCKALKNGEDVSNDPNIVIKYDCGKVTVDADDLNSSSVYPSGGIGYDYISEHGEQANFYLLYKNKIVDTDSCYISRDGQNGAGFVKLELTNEMDGIAVGSDTKLDLEEGKTVSTGTEFILYSGGTELTFSGKIKIEGLNSNASWQVQYGNGSVSNEFNGDGEQSLEGLEGKQRATIKFNLKNDFEFGEDYKDSIKITVWGTNDISEEASATAIYLIMGIRGGKDGDVYKIVPNLDTIMCDPNSPTPYDTSGGLLPTRLTATAYLGLEEIENADITYSIDVTYKSSYGSTTSLPDGGIDIVTELVNKTPDPAQFVTFYLWTSDTTSNSHILVDRETVPIIWHGTNGTSVWIELGNELDAVSVGDDTDLDLGTNEYVEIGTTVMITSGGTQVRIAQDTQGKPKVLAAPHTQSTWDNYAEISYEWDDSDDDSHTIAYVNIKLKNGFNFGEDLREIVTISATADTEDAWTGFTNYVIKGIKGGKDGYVYRLVPEVDYVYFHPNEGVNGTLDFGTGNLDCTAYYGKVKFNEEGFRNGQICYSINVLENSADNINETAPAGNELPVSMTKLPSGGINLHNIITKENYTRYKYIVFYLLIQDNDESPWEIVDRESVPIVADGLNASENVTVELTNEIDSIGVGTDTVLDLPAGQHIRATTGVRLFSGGTELTITNVTGEFTIHNNASKATYSTGWTGNNAVGDLPAKTFYVDLKDKFDFGDDLREKIYLTVKGKNTDNTEATGYATFVVTGIKGAKDGVTYKIQPTPDVVLYDLQNGQWAGNVSNVTVHALMNGKKMSGIPNQIYQIKYSTNSAMDLEVAGDNWGTMAEITDGGSISFTVPTTTGREQSYTFYLAVKEKNADPWTIVDRETVPLVINGREGKDGKDGIGSVSFDMSNENWVVTTGEDTILNIVNQIEGGTYITCSSGSTYPKISVTIDQASKSWIDADPYISARIDENESAKPQLKVTLSKGFNFGSTQRQEIKIHCETLVDEHAADLIFGLVCVKNGAGGKEGVSYQIKTNVGSVLYDSINEKFSPTSIKAWLYEGAEDVTSSYKFSYGILDSDEQQIGSVLTVNGTSGGVTIINNTESLRPVTIGRISITAWTITNEYRDSCDIPIVSSGKDGSGVVADLSNDRDTIALGADLVLNANVSDLGTEVTVWEGSTQLELVSNGSSVECGINLVDTPNNNKVTYGGHIDSTNKAYKVNVEIEDGFNFGIVEGNQIPFIITVKAKSLSLGADNQPEVIEKKVKYTVHGFQGGEDGHVYRIMPSCNTIKLKRNGQTDEYIPTAISAVTTVNGTPNPTSIQMGYHFDEDSDIINYYDPSTPDSANLDIPTLVRGGLNNSIEFLAYSGATKVGNELKVGEGTTLLDKERIFIVSDGVDGEGGLELSLSPENYFVQTDSDFKVKANTTAVTIASMYTGSSAAEISNIAFGELPEAWTTTTADTTENNVKKVEIGIPQDYAFPSNGSVSVAITATYGTSAPQTRSKTFVINASTATNGARGNRGPITRLRDWKLGDGYESGGENDTYWDYVYHNGAYYGCKTNNTGAAENEPGKGADWAACWDKYEGTEFTASKIGFFGTDTKGWLISSEEIQHTSGSITLNGENAAIEMRDMDYNVYRYKNGGDYLYTRVNYRDEHIFNENKGSKVTVYADEACSNAIFDTYVLSGTSSAPTLVLENKKKNIPITLSAKNGQVFARIAGLERPIVAGLDPALSAGEFTPVLVPELTVKANEDITVKIDALCYYEKVEKIESSTATKHIATLKSGSTANFASVIKAGEVEGSKPSYKFYTVTAVTDENYSTSIKNVWISKFGCYPEQILLDRSFSSSNIRMSAQEQSIQTRETFEPAYDIEPCAIDYCSSDDLISIDETATTVSEKYYFCITGSTITSPINSELTEAYFKFQTKNGKINYAALNGDNISVAANIKNRNDVEINSFTLRNDTVPSPPSNTEYTYDPLYNSNENISSDEDIKPLVTVINGDVNGADYGDIILAAGIPIANVLYKYTNTNYGDIYTIGDKTSLPEDTEITAFMGVDRPVEIKAKVKSRTELLYNGNVYTENGTPSDPKISKYASTRIYGDGEIISSKVFATDGSFNGDISARSGNFFGGLNASGCNIYNATIDGQSMFNGTVIVPNGSSLNITNGTNDTLFIAANDAITNTGERKYAARRFNKTESGTWFGLGSKTETDLTFAFIEDIIAISNDTVTFPKFVLEVSGKKISNLTAKLVFTGVQSLTENVLVSNGTINDGSQTFSWTTGDTTYRANGDNISVKMVYSYTIGGGSGNISFSGRFERQIAVGTRKIAPYYAFGNNGLFLSTEKGNITLGGSGLYLTFGNNSIEATQNDMIIKTVSGGYEYSMSLAKMMSQFADVYGTEINLQGYITRRTL